MRNREATLRRRVAPIAAALALALALAGVSGCGGLTLGLKRAGFMVVGAIEIDPLAVATYAANHPEVLVKNSDIGTIEPAAFMNELGVFAGDIDLLCGCPPCQGFSKIRTKNGGQRNRDARNGLSSEMLRFAEVLRPKAVMMENVPGLMKHKSFKALCSGLRKLGYHVHAEITDVQFFGVPQRRRRLILLAGLGFDIALAPLAQTQRTVRSAIGGLPTPGDTGDALHDYPERRSEHVMRLIRDIPKNGGSPKPKSSARLCQTGARKTRSGTAASQGLLIARAASAKTSGQRKR